jgi:cyclohexanone monooxygenase
MKNFVDTCSGLPVEKDLVDGGWTDTLKALTGFFGQSEKGDKKSISAEEASELLQLADYKKMEQIRQRVDRVLKILPLLQP